VPHRSKSMSLQNVRCCLSQCLIVESISANKLLISLHHTQTPNLGAKDCFGVRCLQQARVKSPDRPFICEINALSGIPVKGWVTRG